MVCIRSQAFMFDIEWKSILDIEPNEAPEARLDAEAEADSAAGRVVSHERVKEWIKQLPGGEKIPPPTV
jgi:predicted transcriptional regulator